MDNKNKRAKILKEETINQVTLEDLLDLGSKAQIAILTFTDNCMKFNNRHFQQLSTRLNKDLGDLCNMIRQQISQEVDGVGGSTQEPLDTGDRMKSSDTRSLMANESENLGTEMKPEMDSLAEARIAKRILKKLLEAFDEVDNTATEAPATDPATDDSIEPTETTSTSIDLSPAFATVMDGLSPEQFAAFKSDLINSLKGAGITDQNYMAIVSDIEQTQDIDSLNFALDALYDYGDANGIEINTTVQTDASEENDEDENEGGDIIPTGNPEEDGSAMTEAVKKK